MQIEVKSPFIKQLADALVRKYKNDIVFQDAVVASNEPYRAMVWESGFIAHELLESFDGSDEWADLMEEIDSLMQY